MKTKNVVLFCRLKIYVWSSALNFAAFCADSLSHVSDVAAIVHPQMYGEIYIYLVNVGRQGIRCLLAVKKWCGSRHLVFWSLGTLTGLRDRARGLVA